MRPIKELLSHSFEPTHRLQQVVEAVEEGGELIDELPEDIDTTSEVLGRIADKLEGRSARTLSDAIEATLPWLEGAADVMADALPPVRAAMRIVRWLTNETDPRALGVLAVSLAYQAALGEAAKSITLYQPEAGQTESAFKLSGLRKNLSLAPETIESFQDFQLSTCLRHPLVIGADSAVGRLCVAIGWPEELQKRLVREIHSRFPENFRRILSDGRTKEKFDPLWRYLLFDNDANRADSEDDVHACALSLQLKYKEETRQLCIGVLNSGTHKIEDIEINAIPDDDHWAEITHGSLPQIRPSGAMGVELVHPILGGWFYAKIEMLNANRGLTVATATIEDGEFTKIEFDAFWTDHGGMQRKSHGLVDIRKIPSNFSLMPRK